MEQNEILEETRRTNELLRGQLLWMRAAAALLAVLLAAVVVCLGNTMNSMGRISAALEGVDLAAVAEQVSKLDMDAVNRAISTLDGKISQMDVQAFNDAVAKLNGAVEALQSASDAVKSWGEGVSAEESRSFGNRPRHSFIHTQPNVLCIPFLFKIRII